MKNLRSTFARSVAGSAAVEFAFIAPLFILIMAGVIDFGRGVFTRFTVESAVSSSANYALVNANSVSAAGADTLSQTLATILAGNSANSSIAGRVTINNGSIATLQDGVITKSGSSSSAGSCYCPTLSGGALSWGGQQACGAACGGGGVAGKFVEISAEGTYTPFFLDFGVSSSGKVSSRAVVQTQ